MKYHKKQPGFAPAPGPAKIYKHGHQGHRGNYILSSSLVSFAENPTHAF